MKRKTKVASLADQIIAYEDGELDDGRTVALFQRLVDTGLAWQLQGHYGRTALAYLNAGLVHPAEAADVLMMGTAPVAKEGES
ncbi:DUF7417 domain-containing protein [Anaeromyxobacter diazotrophicus]|uniref:DUF7417 domain-containing protein n=1 Tax=Anaeromyxobacter diazotrophicus TaxID=2590199 RepID=A0A7I9VKJ1_9BACT|nr:hypothetical protein [Anaeromyxobacter diazotrophicus]GEJ56934.1 hypothetical protein AMYX_16750 [Anaeromyxobacter diazotrophicus]